MGLEASLHPDSSPKSAGNVAPMCAPGREPKITRFAFLVNFPVILSCYLGLWLFPPLSIRQVAEGGLAPAIRPKRGDSDGPER
jgi:hypothetical protein